MFAQVDALLNADYGIRDMALVINEASSNALRGLWIEFQDCNLHRVVAATHAFSLLFLLFLRLECCECISGVARI